MSDPSGQPPSWDLPPPPPSQPGPPPGFTAGSGGPGAYASPVPGGPPPLASLGRRFGGALLDGLLIFVTLFVGWAIWSLIVWSEGRTPAKKLLGMRVYKYDTAHPATWGDMFVREFLVSGLLIGVLSSLTFGLGGLIATLLIFGGTLRQTGWDRICGTVVVDER